MQKYTFEELSDEIKEKLRERYSDSAFDEDYYIHSLEYSQEILPNDFGISLTTTDNIYFDISRDMFIENVQISFENEFLNKWRHKFKREEFVILENLIWNRSYTCKWGKHIDTKIESYYDDSNFVNENLEYVLECNICGDINCDCENRSVLEIDDLLNTAEKARDIIVDIIEDALIVIFDNLQDSYEYCFSEEYLNDYIEGLGLTFNEDGDVIDEEGNKLNKFGNPIKEREGE